MNTVGIFRNQLFKGSEVLSNSRQKPSRISKVLYRQTSHWQKPEGAVAHVLNERGDLAGKISEIANAFTTSALPYQTVLKAQPLDLIHAHFAIDGLYALKLAQLKGIPLCTTLHGFDVTVSNKDLLTSRSPVSISLFSSSEET